MKKIIFPFIILSISIQGAANENYEKDCSSILESNQRQLGELLNFLSSNEIERVGGLSADFRKLENQIAHIESVCDTIRGVDEVNNNPQPIESIFKQVTKTDNDFQNQVEEIGSRHNVLLKSPRPYYSLAFKYLEREQLSDGWMVPSFLNANNYSYSNAIDLLSDNNTLIVVNDELASCTAYSVYSKNDQLIDYVSVRLGYTMSKADDQLYSGTVLPLSSKHCKDYFPSLIVSQSTIGNHCPTGYITENEIDCRWEPIIPVQPSEVDIVSSSGGIQVTHPIFESRLGKYLTLDYSWTVRKIGTDQILSRKNSSIPFIQSSELASFQGDYEITVAITASDDENSIVVAADKYIEIPKITITSSTSQTEEPPKLGLVGNPYYRDINLTFHHLFVDKCVTRDWLTGSCEERVKYWESRFINDQEDKVSDAIGIIANAIFRPQLHTCALDIMVDPISEFHGMNPIDFWALSDLRRATLANEADLIGAYLQYVAFRDIIKETMIRDGKLNFSEYNLRVVQRLGKVWFDSYRDYTEMPRDLIKIFAEAFKRAFLDPGKEKVKQLRESIEFFNADFGDIYVSHNVIDNEPQQVLVHDIFTQMVYALLKPDILSFHAKENFIHSINKCMIDMKLDQKYIY